VLALNTDISAATRESHCFRWFLNGCIYTTGIFPARRASRGGSLNCCWPP